MKTWFSSDMHYGHSKVIEYCNRPFANVAEMNAELIKRYCAVVRPEDNVYILGDFSFCNPTDIFAQLPGRKHLILGNHDMGRLSQLKRLPFVWIKDVEEITVGEKRIWLSHYPHRSWPRSGQGSWHLHGHTHGNLRDVADLATLDVGVDCHGYAPIDFEGLHSILSKQPPKLGHHAKAD